MTTAPSALEAHDAAYDAAIAQAEKAYSGKRQPLPHPPEEGK